jgi:hypothetical protein
MAKNKTKQLVIGTLFLGTAAALIPFVLWSSHAATLVYSDVKNNVNAPIVIQKIQPVPMAMVGHRAETIRSPKVEPVGAPTTRSTAELNTRQRFALGMIETANNDAEIGGAGEVSRYQIMPSVWKHYSHSQSYRNPDISVEVAQQHWSVLYATFIKQAHRVPTDFDMYVLWNTRYGYYANKGFNPARLHPVVRDRAQRFTNLVERGEI